VLSTSISELALLAATGLCAGVVNAIAGGGSLLVFPALLAAGFSPLAANVTNSVSQSPGYLGIALGSRRELRGQRSRVLSCIGVAALGAVAGALLLLTLPRAVFDVVVPWLVALAAALLGLQPLLRRWIGEPDPDLPDRLHVLLPAVFVASVYGGYFGGALGVILVATLSLTAHDELRRLNAVKGVLSLVVGIVTVIVFSIGAPVDWLSVALLAPTTLAGGYLGAKLAGRVPAPGLRAGVVLIGLAVAGYLIVN
jgi:uncharacterized membrane protein YfcA